jgi:NADH-quinone oxidoreductase subunit L
LLPGTARAWVYRFALERGYLDAVLGALVVGPFARTFRFLDGLERSWTDFLTGKTSRESDAVASAVGQIEELS